MNNAKISIMGTYSSRDMPENLYFVTASVCGWKPLFAQYENVQLVLDSLVWMMENAYWFLFCFVIMPTHIHFIIKPIRMPIGATIQQFGSYTAHRLLNSMKEKDELELLQFFAKEKRDKRHQHSLWQDIQAQNIYSFDFLTQKMEYLHSNPVSKKWNLAKSRSEYVYSSACFYDDGIAPMIRVDDIREYLLDQSGAMEKRRRDGGWSETRAK